MRHILTVLFAALVLFSACAKDQEETPVRKFLSVQLDSFVVVAENPVALISPANLTDTDPSNDMDKLTITATGLVDEDVTITLLGSTEGLATGSFYSQDGNSISIQYTAPDVSLIANQSIGDLTFTITKVQDSLIEATFNGTFIDTTGIILPRNATFGFVRAIVKHN